MVEPWPWTVQQQTPARRERFRASRTGKEAPAWIKSRTVLLFAASMAAFVLGIYASSVRDLSNFVIFSQTTNVYFSALVVFSFSLLFFGFPAPWIMLFMGVYVGWLLNYTQFSMRIAGIVASSFLAVFASLVLGGALLDDMRGKGNFKRSLGFAIVLAIAAVGLGAVFDLLKL